LGVNFSGFIAWFLWRTIYLWKLPQFEKKIRVALDWTLDLIFGKDLVRLVDSGSSNTLYIEEDTTLSAASEP